MQKKYSLKLFKTSIQINDGSIICLFFYLKQKYFLIESNIKSNILWKNNNLVTNKSVITHKISLYK